MEKKRIVRKLSPMAKCVNAGRQKGLSQEKSMEMCRKQVAPQK